jgi:phosphinothricin acetyltransferase
VNRKTPRGASKAPLVKRAAARGPLRICDATDADMPAIQAIYAHHVTHGFGSFEEIPPDLAEMVRRRQDVLARGLPYLVAADRDGRVLGFSYASPYRLRAAYRYTVEDSIYVAPETVGCGIGARLLKVLITRTTKLGYRQMIAVIGDSENRASMRVHASQGFRKAAIMQGIGFKLGRWVDSVLMQRPLGPGNRRKPSR